MDDQTTMNGEAASLLPKNRSANGTSASVCLAGRIMRSNIRDLSGWMRSERGGAEELPTHALGNDIYACPTLVTVGVNPANRAYKSVDGLLYDKQVTAILRCPEGRSEPVVLPSTITTVGRMAIHDCLNLSSISLPESVTAIGQMAFYRCMKLERVAIPRFVKKLEAQTVVDCPRLESISLPEGLEEIDDGVFWGCTSLKTIPIPASVTKIHEKAFEECPAIMIYEKPPE